MIDIHLTSIKFYGESLVAEVSFPENRLHLSINVSSSVKEINELLGPRNYDLPKCYFRCNHFDPNSLVTLIVYGLNYKVISNFLKLILPILEINTTFLAIEVLNETN